MNFNKENAVQFYKSVFKGLLIILVMETVQASYLDPIDTPSYETRIGASALQLDIEATTEKIVSVGERGIILYSEDQGQNWKQAKVPTSLQLNALFFLDHRIGWAVGQDYLVLKTTDGGVSWVHQYDNRSADLKGPFMDVWFRDQNEGYAVGVYNALYRTTDGGNKWHSWQEHISNEDEWHLFSIAASDSENIYIASEAGLIFRSMDGGEYFEPLRTGHNGSFHGIIAQRNSIGLDTILSFGVGGVVMLSVNGGLTWEKIEIETVAGISNGLWLSSESALLTVADGSLIVVNIKTHKVKKISTELGLPLSAAAFINKKLLALVGHGGVQVFSVGLLGLGDSNDE